MDRKFDAKKRMAVFSSGIEVFRKNLRAVSFSGDDSYAQMGIEDLSKTEPQVERLSRKDSWVIGDPRNSFWSRP
jgi:hypothetical protein